MESDERRPLACVSETWAHPLGWELQLLIDGCLPQTVQCDSSSLEATRPAEVMLQTIEEWRRAMLDKGWRPYPAIEAASTS